MATPPILLWDQAYNRNGDAKLPRAVVNVIRTYMHNDTLTGYVKATTLAEQTGLQVRGVRKQIAANVKAGWLEIVESGNSSGLANTYRLTYPKGVPEGTRGVLQDTVKGVPQDTPTSPPNFSENFSKKFEERTSPQEKGVPQDTVPFASDSVARSGAMDRQHSTSESKGVRQDMVSEAPARYPEGFVPAPLPSDPWA